MGSNVGSLISSGKSGRVIKTKKSSGGGGSSSPAPSGTTTAISREIKDFEYNDKTFNARVVVTRDGQVTIRDAGTGRLVDRFNTDKTWASKTVSKGGREDLKAIDLQRQFREEQARLVKASQLEAGQPIYREITPEGVKNPVGQQILVKEKVGFRPTLYEVSDEQLKAERETNNIIQQKILAKDIPLVDPETANIINSSGSPKKVTITNTPTIKNVITGEDIPPPDNSRIDLVNRPINIPVAAPPSWSEVFEPLKEYNPIGAAPEVSQFSFKPFIETVKRGQERLGFITDQGVSNLSRIQKEQTNIAKSGLANYFVYGKETDLLKGAAAGGKSIATQGGIVVGGSLLYFASRPKQTIIDTGKGLGNILLNPVSSLGKAFTYTKGDPFGAIGTAGGAYVLARTPLLPKNIFGEVSFTEGFFGIRGAKGTLRKATKRRMSKAFIRDRNLGRAYNPQITRGNDFLLIKKGGGGKKGRVRIERGEVAGELKFIFDKKVSKPVLQLPPQKPLSQFGKVKGESGLKGLEKRVQQVGQSVFIGAKVVKPPKSSKGFVGSQSVAIVRQGSKRVQNFMKDNPYAFVFRPQANKPFIPDAPKKVKGSGSVKPFDNNLVSLSRAVYPQQSFFNPIGKTKKSVKSTGKTVGRQKPIWYGTSDVVNFDMRPTALFPDLIEPEVVNVIPKGFRSAKIKESLFKKLEAKRVGTLRPELKLLSKSDLDLNKKLWFDYQVSPLNLYGGKIDSLTLKGYPVLSLKRKGVLEYGGKYDYFSDGALKSDLIGGLKMRAVQEKSLVAGGKIDSLIDLKKDSKSLLALSTSSKSVSKSKVVPLIDTTPIRPTPKPEPIIRPPKEPTPKPPYRFLPSSRPPPPKPPKQPKPPKIPSDFNTGFSRRSIPKGIVGKAYDVFVRRKGEDLLIGSGLTRAGALSLGAKRVSTTLAASFKIRAGKGTARISGGADYFRGVQNRFRTFKKSKGSKIPLQDEFIEKRKFRLSTRSEVSQIKAAKKTKSVFLKGGGKVGGFL